MRIPLGPLPIAIGGDIIYPKKDACFACTPPYQHPRKWIPDSSNGRMQRTLVLCFDGTCDSFDKDNSNVVQFLSALKKDDPEKQLVYYQAGIGTYAGNDLLGTSLIRCASGLLDEMLAWNLPAHIKGGYLFLMQNYHVGDHICIFGFSRGAYTALALAGMLQKVGLLPQCNIEQLPFAYAMYEREDKDGLDLSVQFKQTFSIDVNIQFLGVWDTVQSVGMIPKHLPFSGYNNAVVNFRHALALDEHRVKFMPFFYVGRKLKHWYTKIQAFEFTDAAGGGIDISDVIGGLWKSAAVSNFEVHMNTMTGPDTNVEEVFFAGAHCDVGGGSVKNGTRHSLARIPLRWMIRECFKVQSGIIFDAHMLKHEIGLDIDSIPQAPILPSSHLYPPTEPNDAELQGITCPRILFTILCGLGFPLLWLWSKIESLHIPKMVLNFPKRRRFEYEGEAEETVQDALSQIYDQLDRHWYWKVMEWIPWVVKKQSAEVADDFWAYKLVWNRGKGRRVYNSMKHPRIKVHKSVRTRMLAESVQGDNNPYWPKIRCMINGVVRRPTRKEWLADDPDFLEWVD